MEKLKTVQEAPWMNVCLGVHECDLCPEEEAPEGNGEVRIPGVPGVAHAAPFLITHYITHGHRPPQVFIDAVLAADVELLLEQGRANLRTQPEPDRSEGDRPVEDVGSLVVASRDRTEDL
ncbi:hypothetical protein ACFUZD_30525 [Streptomyces cinereoruber]|uniref:DUF7919 family protein n=1 Tax=Streptomyces cinereoruber TaxID=67260 RepID=UPI0036335C90